MAITAMVIEALERELAQLPKDLRTSALAATAKAMAMALDDPENSATSKSMCAGRMLDIMNRLRELAPPDTTHTKLDELLNRRQQRLGRPAT